MNFGVTLSNRGVLVGICTTSDLLTLADAVEASPLMDSVWCGDALFVNRRVDRPNEVDIRIFPKYDEPELIKVGNPALQPQYSTSAELGFRTGWAAGSVYAAAYHRIVDGTITRIATQVPGSVLLYNVFQNGGRSWSTGSEVVWQQTISRRVSLGANANGYRRTIAAFSVVNRYPVPIPYSAPRQRLTSAPPPDTPRQGSRPIGSH